MPCDSVDKSVLEELPEAGLCSSAFAVPARRPWAIHSGRSLIESFRSDERGLWWSSRVPAQAPREGCVSPGPLWRVQAGVRSCIQGSHCYSFHFLYNIADSQAACQIQNEYMACLKAEKNDAAACQDLAKAYLNCRMDRSGNMVWLCFCAPKLRLQYRADTVAAARNLMARQDLQELGLREKVDKSAEEAKEATKDSKRQKGFIAGVR